MWLKFMHWGCEQTTPYSARVCCVFFLNVKVLIVSIIFLCQCCWMLMTTVLLATAIILSNMRSLENKTLIKSDVDYQHISLFCFTETWLSKDVDFELEGFNIIPFNRDAVRTQKSIGGCQQKVGNTTNGWLAFRPHYLLREFSQITAILVYVPGPDFNLAAEHIADSYNRAVSQTGEQPVFLLGDINRCDITTHRPTLEQYVTTPTRLQNTLDLCFGNIPGAYISKPCPPLGLPDHNIILLLPRYRSKLKTDKPVTRTQLKH